MSSHNCNTAVVIPTYFGNFGQSVYLFWETIVLIKCWLCNYIATNTNHDNFLLIQILNWDNWLSIYIVCTY